MGLMLLARGKIMRDFARDVANSVDEGDKALPVHLQSGLHRRMSDPTQGNLTVGLQTGHLVRADGSSGWVDLSEKTL